MKYITAVCCLICILRTVISQGQVISDSAFSILPDSIVVSEYSFSDCKRTNPEILELLVSTPKGILLSKEELYRHSFEDMQQIISQHVIRNVWVTHHLTQENQVRIDYRIREIFPIHGTALLSFSDRNFNEWWRNGREYERVSAYGELEIEYLGKRNSTLQLMAEIGFNSKASITYQQRFAGKEGRFEPAIGLFFARNTNILYSYNNDGSSNLLLDDNPVYSRFTGVLGFGYRNSKFSRINLSVGIKKEEISKRIDSLNPNFLGGGRARFSTYSVATYKFNRKSSGFHPAFQFLFETKLPVVLTDNQSVQTALNVRIKRIYSWDRWQWEGKFDVSNRLGKNLGFIDNPELTNDNVPLRTYDAYRNLSNFNLVARNEIRFRLWQKTFYGFHNYFPFRVFLALNNELAYSASISSDRNLFPSSGFGIYIQAPFGIELRLYLADNLLSKPSPYFFLD